MTTPAETSFPPPGRTLTPEKALHRLFITLFLRGRSSRGLRKETTPKSVGSKLILTLVFYGLLGCLAITFIRQPVFTLAIYLHAMTFVFLGMFISSSAGEILFNKEEADILLHRPVTPQALLWAKVRVLVEISLWIAMAFNLAGLIVGVFSANGDWRFPVVHIISTILEALFCAACIVMVYQLCIRWFGRERLDSIMTTAQVFVSIAAVLSGQILPQIASRFSSFSDIAQHSWWIALLPPAWFAGFDDALAGTMSIPSGLLALTAIVATAVVLWIAFAKLARDYQTGLQRLNENVSRTPRSRQRRRWIDTLVHNPPFSWWLRDPAARASFLLTTAYLVRDREVKLRLYPSIAPFLVLPFIFIFRTSSSSVPASLNFGASFAGAYLGILPMIAINILHYSQQWQASDIFHIAPIPGPALICRGTRCAVLFFIAAPVVTLFAVSLWFIHHDFSSFFLLLPGIIAMPVYAILPNLTGKGLPFVIPIEEGKSASRGLVMIFAFLIAIPLAALGAWSRATGWFHWFILAESLLSLGIYYSLRFYLSHQPWPSIE